MPSNPGRDGARRINRRRALTVSGAAVLASLTTAPLPRVGPPFGTAPDAAATLATPPAGDDPIDVIHAAGVTGEGVRVGVVDPTGFDPTHPELAEFPTTLRGIGDSPVAVSRPTHGTAAAVTVARLAPDVRLSLARFERPGEFTLAIDWFQQQDVDVVLAPVAAYGIADVRRAPVTRAARDAVAAGMVVVAPTGNAAQGHWQRPLAPESLTGTGSLSEIQVRSRSGGGPPTGRLVAWLTHDGPPGLELTLALFRLTATGDGRNLIALSTATPTRAGTRLTAQLDGGAYRLVVRAAEPLPRGEPLDTFRVAVTTPTHRLHPATQTGSIAAPAVVDSVLAVGAAGDAGAAPYSGRGPTPNGRPGVDLVAPPRPWSGPGQPGTSAAAARTAGVAALVRGVLGEREPRAVTSLLRATATDVNPSGPDFASGHGQLAPLRAVRRARAEDGV